MEDLKFNAVNVSTEMLEEQKENLKNHKFDGNGNKMMFDPKNYLNLKIEHNEQSKTVKIRLLPISATDGTVFFDITTHSLKVDKEVAKSGFKTYLCLNDPKTESKEECPICKKSRDLFEKGKEARNNGDEALAKSLFKEANSLKKKKTFIVRVIDREHEDEGVKFWRFNENSTGNGIYDKLMALYQTRKEEAKEDGEDNYSIFDLYNGKDIIVTATKSMIPDGFGGTKEKVAYNITDSGNRKPLTKDIEKGNTWLTDTKTWKDVYSNKTADYLEIVANGKVPVYDKEEKKFVEKKAFDKQLKETEELVANQLLKEQPIINIEEDEELPF